MRKGNFHFLIIFIMLFTASSCLNQGKAPKIPGIDGPKLNIQNGKILLSVGLEKVDLQTGLTLPLPKLKRSSISLAPRLEGGTLLQVAFDPKDIESDNFRIVDEQLLPDGRPFPFLVGGTLPALAVNVPKIFDTTFYASNKLFGFFLPIKKMPINLGMSIHYRLKINGKSVGIVSLINPDNQGNGAGVVLLLTMDEIRRNKNFMKLLKYSKRYKNKVF